MSEKVYRQGDLPGGEFHDFRKMSITQAMRMNGPFSVETIDGNIVHCDDGWLLVDSHGHPYPCAHAEFIAIYTPVAFEEKKSA